MPGPFSDPNSRRSASRGGVRVLPLEGRKGKSPPLGRNPAGRAWNAATKEWWAGIWHSPAATAWADTDVHMLRMMAALVDQAHCGEGTGATMHEIRMLADSFGLTPYGRARLRWRVEDEPGEVATIHSVPAWIPDPREEEAG